MWVGGSPRGKGLETRGPGSRGLCSFWGSHCFSSPFRASGRKLEKFTVSVNVAAGSKVTFELNYEELLKRHKGKYEMYLKVQPKQLVKHFEVTGHSLVAPEGMGCQKEPWAEPTGGV